MSQQKNNSESRIISVVGLGYVGLPVAVSFARAGRRVIAFDIDQARIKELADGIDRTLEVDPSELSLPDLEFTSDPSILSESDFFIVTVPTPINQAKRPDLTALYAASKTVGAAIRPGAIVVYESTVYPGATEEDCVPVLERESGLKCGVDFTVGYSPERINPGDKKHRFETITKVVSGQDEATLECVAEIYSSVVTAGVHRAPTIKTAEAAKVIENTQRDLNIAFMNELAQIFGRMGIDTSDVLAAASTKWNFLQFSPGLVGGHCIGVDPYYLTHKAELIGHHPQVILSGRRVNDAIGTQVAQQALRYLLKAGIGSPRVAVLGLTFKENVPDIRNTRVIDIVHELTDYGINVEVCDPLADPAEVREEHRIELVSIDQMQPADSVILAVAHEAFRTGGWPFIAGLLRQSDQKSASPRGQVIDVKAILDRGSCPDGITLWRL